MRHLPLHALSPVHCVACEPKPHNAHVVASLLPSLLSTNAWIQSLCHCLSMLALPAQKPLRPQLQVYTYRSVAHTL